MIYNWQGMVARRKQRLPQGNWQVWLNMAGRGNGKTRTGAETIRTWKEQGFSRMALVAEDAADARDVMIEGESGIMSVCPPWDRPTYNSSIKRLTWANGAIATLYSSVDPESLRGPQHEKAWCDELAKWRYAQETWDNLQMGMRIGDNPQTVVTTTPRPIKLLQDLLSRDTTHVTHGSTYENLENLSPAFKDIIAKYEGTRLGRQELNAELLEDVDGALWTRAMIEAGRTTKPPEALKRVIVGVDPSVTATESSDETGIVVAAKAWCTCKGQGEDHYFILADKSLRGLPAAWGGAAVNAYHDFKADKIVAEGNNGGELVRSLIKGIDKDVPIVMVHASRGKVTRAEPVSLLYEQGKVHHVGAFPALEDQMCTYVPGEDSPDHMDALVWSMTALRAGGGWA